MHLLHLDTDTLPRRIFRLLNQARNNIVVVAVVVCMSHLDRDSLILSNIQTFVRHAIFDRVVVVVVVFYCHS